MSIAWEFMLFSVLLSGEVNKAYKSSLQPGNRTYFYSELVVSSLAVSVSNHRLHVPQCVDVQC